MIICCHWRNKPHGTDSMQWCTVCSVIGGNVQCVLVEETHRCIKDIRKTTPFDLATIAIPHAEIDSRMEWWIACAPLAELMRQPTVNLILWTLLYLMIFNKSVFPVVRGTLCHLTFCEGRNYFPVVTLCSEGLLTMV